MKVGETTTTTNPIRSLIVIGAGVSGIKLAHTILSMQNPNSNLHVTILEANDYIGGRMRHGDFCGHTVELGANWISGLDTKFVFQNPVYRLAQRVQLQGRRSDRTTETAILALDSATDGNDITKEYCQSVTRFNDMYQRAVRACQERRVEPPTDVTVRALLTELGWKDLNNVDRLVEYNLLEVWILEGLERLSAAHNLEEGANDVDLGTEEIFVEDSRGFNCILGDMVEDIRRWGGAIHLNCHVQQICYAPGEVRVVAAELDTTSSDAKFVEYTADAVACTVSLGVLQSGTMDFVPKLPDWKVRALHEMEMFVFAKVYAKLDHEFWSSKDKEQFTICSERKGHYPLWMKYKNAEDNNLFMCYLGGAEAIRVESLTTEQIKDEIEELFRHAFRKQVAKQGLVGGSDIFRPSCVKVTDWSKNPRFCGSYSASPVGAFAQVPFEDLTEGLTGTESRQGPKTLYFAGEALDDKFNGWVQGGYLSGGRVAKAILGISESST